MFDLAIKKTLEKNPSRPNPWILRRLPYRFKKKSSCDFFLREFCVLRYLWDPGTKEFIFFTRRFDQGTWRSTCSGFNILLRLDEKGDVSTRDNGSDLGRLSRLGSDLGRASMTKNNFSLYYNRANLRLVEDLEHNGW
ncbi:hypothetical protein GQ457_09G017060 [Hibiscus cannabinus]